MAWQAELSVDAKTDLQQIFRHVMTVQHEDFGYGLSAASSMATTRIHAIIAGIDRILIAPHRGVPNVIQGVTFRHLTIERAIYWFTLDNAAQVLRIEAIFHGGQDHWQHMLSRLMGKAP